MGVPVQKVPWGAGRADTDIWEQPEHPGCPGWGHSHQVPQQPPESQGPASATARSWQQLLTTHRGSRANIFMKG